MDLTGLSRQLPVSAGHSFVGMLLFLTHSKDYYKSWCGLQCFRNTCNFSRHHLLNHNTHGRVDRLAMLPCKQRQQQCCSSAKHRLAREARAEVKSHGEDPRTEAQYSEWTAIFNLPSILHSSEGKVWAPAFPYGFTDLQFTGESSAVLPSFAPQMQLVQTRFRVLLPHCIYPGNRAEQ